jgi:hypothetical protein
MKYLDAVSVHPYRDYSRSPEDVFTDYQKLRGLIEHYAPPEKMKMPIISSEWGYASATRGISFETQAAYVVRMQLANLLFGIPISIWYDWKNDGDEPGNFEHNCGIVTSDLRPKPAYTTVKTMNEQLMDFTLLKRFDMKNESDFILLFRNDRGTCRICAWTIDPPHSVIMNDILSPTANLKAIDGKGNILKLKSDKNRLVLELNDLPQYITLPAGFRN